MGKLKIKLASIILSMVLGITLISGGTIALFNDVEVSSGNLVHAGTIDLDDGITQTKFNVPNVRPGSEFSQTYHIKNNGSLNAGHVYITASNYSTSIEDPEDPGDGGSGPILIWDKSSLEFKNSVGGDCIQIWAIVTNGGDQDMLAPSVYEVYWSADDNPQKGTKLAFTGVINPLKAGESQKLTFNLSDNPNGPSGKYKFKAYQHPGHPGSGALWSDTITADCGTSTTGQAALITEESLEIEDSVDLGTQIQVTDIIVKSSSGQEESVLDIFKAAAGVTDDLFLSDLNKPEFRADIGLLASGDYVDFTIHALFILSDEDQSAYQGAKLTFDLGFELMQEGFTK